MQRRSILIVSASLIVVAGAIKLGWDYRAGRGGPAAWANSGMAPGAGGEKAAPAPNQLIRVEDATQVFQRAFWRRPGAGDRVLHGVRREWTDAGAAVKKWQWYVAVEPSPEFRRWLLEDNPFELAPASPGTPLPAMADPPDWFPAAEALLTLPRYRNLGGNFFVFHDAAANRIYATDHGAGFAAPAR